MAYITVRAQDGNVSKKGEIVRVSDTALWALGDRLPNVLRLEITGTTADQINNWLTRVKDLVQYTVVNENAQGWRCKMELDPAVIAAVGAGNTFRQDLKDWILWTNEEPPAHFGNWQCSFVSQTPSSLTVDIAKGQPYDLQQIKQDVDAIFRDRWETTFHCRRYYFPDAVIDPRIAQAAIDEPLHEDAAGNLPSNWFHDAFTSTQALNNIVDRLA